MYVCMYVCIVCICMYMHVCVCLYVFIYTQCDLATNDELMLYSCHHNRTPCVTVVI